MNTMVEISDLIGFVNDLEKIIYYLRFKLILKRKNNDRALFRVNANLGAVANDGIRDIRDLSWFVPSIDPCNDKKIFAQKVLNKKKK